MSARRSATEGLVFFLKPLQLHLQAPDLLVELVHRGGFLISLGEDRRPMPAFQVAVLRFETVKFGPYLLGERFTVQPGDLVEPGPDLRGSELDLLFGSYTDSLAWLIA